MWRRASLGARPSAAPPPGHGALHRVRAGAAVTEGGRRHYIEGVNGREPAAAVTIAAVAALLLAAAPAALAQEAGSGQEIPTCEAGETAMRTVDGMIQSWKIDDPTTRALEQRGVTVTEGLAQVGVHVDHGDWGKARSLAYTRAYLDAMGAFVRQTNEEITTETVRNLLQDATSLSFYEDEDASSFLERVDRKQAALAELQLDQALKEAGMSDEEIAELSGAQKIPRYRDSTFRESTSLAFGRAAGLVPLKTFEAIDCDGNSSVGVAVAFSTRMRALAEQIHGGEPIRPNPDRGGTSLRDRIGALSDDDLVTQFGVRIWWDEEGYPVIIAFGQWGWSTKALTAAQRDRRYRFARNQAAAQARSYLAEFIQANAQFTSSSFVGDAIDEAVRVSGDGFREYLSGTEIVDRVVEEARIRAAVQLTGLGTLRTWSAPHPVAEHQELTGAVAYWSPAREDEVRASLGLEAKHPAPEPESEQPQPTASGTAESKDLMDASDF